MSKKSQARRAATVQQGSLSSPLDEGTSEAILAVGENSPTTESADSDPTTSNDQSGDAPASTKEPVDSNTDTPFESDPLDPTTEAGGDAAIPSETSVTETVSTDQSLPAVASNLATKAAAARIERAGDRGISILGSAEARKAAGVAGTLTVNSSSDALRGHVTDTADMTLRMFKDPKSKEMKRVTSKLPDCDSIKGVRRKTKDGFTGELTMIGHMVAFIEEQGGVARAEDVARHMEERFLNFDRGYLRGSGKGKYSLWDIEGVSPDSRRGKGGKKDKED